MKVLTLNIRHGGGTRVDGLLEALTKSEADVVVLTEYRENGNGNRIRSSLFALGHKWQASSSIVSDQNAAFVASRYAFVSAIGSPGLGDARHRVLTAQFEGFNLIGVYFPQNEAKRPVFNHLAAEAGRLLGERGLVIGDLNTGKHFEDEAGKTFA